MAEFTKDTPYPLAGHMTYKDYAVHRQITTTRLSQLLKSGRLDGCWTKGYLDKYNIDWKKADAELDKTAHFRDHLESTGALTPRHIIQKEPVDAAEDDDSEDVADKKYAPAAKSELKKAKSSGTVQDFSTSKNEEAHFKAKLQRLKFEELDKTLISAEDAKRQVYEMARAIRDNLIELPDRVCAEFAAIRDDRKIAIRLDEEIRTALERIIKIIDAHDAEHA